jgi:hypothetical protein
MTLLEGRVLAIVGWAAMALVATFALVVLLALLRA